MINGLLLGIYLCGMCFSGFASWMLECFEPNKGKRWFTVGWQAILWPIVVLLAIYNVLRPRRR